MATIRKGDTVRFVGRSNQRLVRGGLYIVNNASSSHVKIEVLGRIITNWVQIENFELVRSVYRELVRTFLVYEMPDVGLRSVALSIGPGLLCDYRDKPAAENAYRRAGYTIIGWKKVTLPFRLENNNG